uniref:Uncharacterized protein n=1 Tax=Brassica oleracea TaxID=3712 RepID=A0A3P6ENJ4_BRAOL|nr:unnamed protein product [Brassica oleracea]
MTEAWEKLEKESLMGYRSPSITSLARLTLDMVSSFSFFVLLMVF